MVGTLGFSTKSYGVHSIQSVVRLAHSSGHDATNALVLPAKAELAERRGQSLANL